MFSYRFFKSCVCSGELLLCAKPFHALQCLWNPCNCDNWNMPLSQFQKYHTGSTDIPFEKHRFYSFPGLLASASKSISQFCYFFWPFFLFVPFETHLVHILSFSFPFSNKSFIYTCVYLCTEWYLWTFSDTHSSISSARNIDDIFISQFNMNLVGRISVKRIKGNSAHENLINIKSKAHIFV